MKQLSPTIVVPGHGELQPQIAYPLGNLALLYTQQKKYTEAEMLYQQALT